MKTLEDVLVELRVERTEMLSWVEASWVRPDPDAAGPRFHPVDVARLRLIQELHHDLAIDPETMPVVLSLIDEMYTLRRRLGALTRALAETAPEVRSTVRARCQVFLWDAEQDDGAADKPAEQPKG